MSLDEAAPALPAPPALPAVPDGRMGRMLSWAARRWWLTLSLLCLVLWTPGVLSLPPLDRDESRFAQSSRQMLESGNFIDIRFGHVPRYKKPVGIYWLQSAATFVAGLGDRSHIWTYRLPSLLGGILAVLLCFWTARAFAIPEVAWTGAALMGTSVLLTAEATIATTDAVQLACLMGAIGVLLRVYLAARDPENPAPSLRLILIGWAAFAAGILIKGPVVPAVCALTVIALIAWDRWAWRWLKALRPLYGAGIVLLIVAPWAVAISFQSHGEFYEQSLGQDFAAKLAGGQESHGAWPGYYLALVTLTFWPAILFVVPGLGAAIRRHADPATRFLLAWAGASWLMFEIVPTKLPHYVLPAYPALALLAALWLLTPRTDERRWQPILVWLAAVQFALGVAAFAAAPVLAPRFYGAGSTWWLMAAAGLGAALGLAALVLYLRRSVLGALASATLAVLAFYPAIAAGAAPRLDTIWVSPRAAALVNAHKVSGDPPPVLAGYTEPSLVFLLGTDTSLTDGTGAAEVGAAQGGLALIEDRERPAFLAHLAELEADAVKVGELDGLNYSRGKRVHITLYRVSATHDVTVPPAE